MMNKPTVSLALGSGGARGLAHIGVIEVLEEEGFLIRNIAGSSMGACVGGIYCAGKLEVFRDWIVQINRMETFRLMDFTMSTQGVLKGKKVLEHLKTILGEIQIENFDIPYTAVATDVSSKEEIWMRTGDLYSVIRTSSSVPTLMMPIKLGDRVLVDGGVLNPLPLEPLMPKSTDLVIAVNINANADGHMRSREMRISEELEKAIELSEEESNAYSTRMVKKVKGWLGTGQSEPTDKTQEKTLSYLGMLNKSYDFMQDRLCEQSIQIHKPDIVINIPRAVGTTLEFYKAQVLVEEGRTAARKAIAEWKLNQLA
ncbi:patatin-like phospholipase family protein [Flavobacteriales bacterium]|nr:patatin-like phospholipase family protein [Flavobacteriales bacterium]